MRRTLSIRSAPVPDVLLIGDTPRLPELRHEVPVDIGDPFLYAEVGGRRVSIVWSVEGDRIAAVDPTIELIPSETFPLEPLLREGLDPYEVYPELFSRMVASLGLTSAVVPERFPLGIADRLRADGVELVVDQRFYDERRRRKSDIEIAGIRSAQRAAEAGMKAIAMLLRRSEPGESGRVVDGEPLTCELLREAAGRAFADHGCRGDDMTVSHGAQTADGHDPGHGRVGNDDTILCDLFPQHLESACFADMSRTFRVGTPDEEIAAWHAQSVEALRLAVSLVRPGVEGGSIHAAVCAFFEERGHLTQRTRPEGTVQRDGFNHGLGHGVGLEVHEAPGVSRLSHALVAGDVIALEPGLYRKGFGGVRVEDLVLVTEGGCEVLTEYAYGLEP
jgi:Xaa-Pro aminopeptidase